MSTTISGDKTQAGELEYDCRWCETDFGMQPVHMDKLAGMNNTEIAKISPLYRGINDQFLYYVCPHCNPTGVIPPGMEQID